LKKTRVFFRILFTSLILFGFAGASYSYDLSSWYFRTGKQQVKAVEVIGSGLADQINPSNNRRDFSGITFAPLMSPIWLGKDYNTDLSWMAIQQLRIEFVFDPNQWQGHDWKFNGLTSDDSGVWGSPYSDANFRNSNPAAIDLRPDNFGYGLQINSLVYDTMVNLSLWYGSEGSAFTSLSSSSWNPTAARLQLVNNRFYSRNKNIAATLSKDLRFLNFIHQGISPTIRLETSYKLDVNKAVYTSPGVVSRVGGFDELNFGMSYEGKNNIEWLNPSYSISWGFGYNYSRVLDVPEIISAEGSEKFDTKFGTHSGNINASTYWMNMRLMTMVMYLYDLQSKDGITLMQANYTPDLRWTYGLRANYLIGEGKTLRQWIEEPDLVTFSVTYKW